MKLHLLLIILLSCVACASNTMTKEQCHVGDWHKIGLVDGKKGRHLDFLQNHEKSCQNSTNSVDQAAYWSGRQRGLEIYCTKEGGYQAGENMKPYSGVCRGDAEAEFKRYYKKGYRMALLQRDRAEIRQQIEEERERIQNDKSVFGHVVQLIHLIGGSSPTEGLENAEKDINKEIRHLEGQAPVIQSSHAIYQPGWRGALDFMGAGVGMTVGFGAGHAIQGRYKSDGWIWTVADTAALGSAILTTQAYCHQSQYGANYNECDNALPIISVVAIFASRLLQAIDLWGHLFRSGQEYENYDRDDPWGVGSLPSSRAIGFTF